MVGIVSENGTGLSNISLDVLAAAEGQTESGQAKCELKFRKNLDFCSKFWLKTHNPHLKNVLTVIRDNFMDILNQLGRPFGLAVHGCAFFNRALKLLLLSSSILISLVTQYASAAPQRTIMLIEGTTISGQDMFFRGGIDANWSNANRGTQCTGSTIAGGNQNIPCSMPITHLNLVHANTKPWRFGDNFLDWGKLVPANDGREPLQSGVNAAGQTAVGTPAVWTTNDPAYAKKIYSIGNGYTPLNTYGPHYWLVDVEMECNSAVNGWFEFKTFISNGPGWEADIDQNQFMGFTAPSFGASSKNHMGRCGMINVFRRGFNEPVDIKAFPAGWPVANFTLSATGAGLTFDASASTNVTQYRWDLNGDGVYEADWSTSKTANIVFTQAGTFKARLWARDEVGKDSFLLKDINLVAVPNVTGQTQTAAQASLSSAGFSLGSVTFQPSNTMGVGSVISQSHFISLANSTVNIVVSNGTPPSIYQLRGTQNQSNNVWLEGDFFIPVAGSDTNYEICRNFVAGDANGGPRFRVDPNGGWGADAFPAGDLVAGGWTKVVINGSTRTIVSTTINMAPNCAAALVGYHLRGTHNQWAENDLFEFVPATMSIPVVSYSICRNFTVGDAAGGPRFKIDENGGWGADEFPVGSDIAANGWTRISFTNSPAINFQVITSLGPNCSAPPSIYQLRGTHLQWNNVWLEGDFFSPVAGSNTDFEICRNFVAGDANGGPRFRVDPNGAWGDDAFPFNDIPAGGWTRIVINGAAKTILSVSPQLSANCGGSVSSSSAANNSSATSSSSVAPVAATVVSAWIGRSDTLVTFPIAANGREFLRSTASNCNFASIFSCINGQTSILDGSVVADTAATLNRSAYYMLKDGAKQSLIPISSATDEAMLMSREGSRIITFQNKFWLIGGKSKDVFKNDVWSSIDGKRWNKEIANASFPGRYAHQVAVFNNKIWLYGGADGSGLLADAWMSTDGINWSQQSQSGLFPARINGQLTVFNNLLWVIGGNNGDLYKNDVWSSTDGVNWVVRNASAAFSPRENHRVAVFNNQLFLTGGFNDDGLKQDVYSSTNGVDWVWQSSSNPKFSARHGHQLIVKNAKLVLIGGFDNISALNDIWLSANGIDWTKQTSTSAPAGRGSQQFAELNGQLFLMGGQDSTGNLRNELSSSSDAITWTLQTSLSNITKRTDNPEVVFNNKLWLVGGYSSDEGYKRDVWSSTDGLVWNLQTAEAAFSKRGFHSLTVFNNQLWLIGGSELNGTLGKNDVWSSADGITWTQRTAAAAFSKRWSHQVVVYNNKLWLIGGFDSATETYLNDVWSSADGITWVQQQPSAAFSAREGSQVISFAGKLWLFGGFNAAEGYKNDTWTSVDGITWSKSQLISPFSKRYGHQVLVHLNVMWLIGGSAFDQLTKDSFQSFDGNQWVLSNPGSDLPSRTFHRALSYNGKLFIFGGQDADGQVVNDVWALDSGSWRFGFRGDF